MQSGRPPAVEPAGEDGVPVSLGELLGLLRHPRAQGGNGEDEDEPQPDGGGGRRPQEAARGEEPPEERGCRPPPRRGRRSSGSPPGHRGRSRERRRASPRNGPRRRPRPSRTRSPCGEQAGEDEIGGEVARVAGERGEGEPAGARRTLELERPVEVVELEDAEERRGRSPVPGDRRAGASRRDRESPTLQPTRQAAPIQRSARPSRRWNGWRVVTRPKVATARSGATARQARTPRRSRQRTSIAPGSRNARGRREARPSHSLAWSLGSRNDSLAVGAKRSGTRSSRTQRRLSAHPSTVTPPTRAEDRGGADRAPRAGGRPGLFALLIAGEYMGGKGALRAATGAAPTTLPRLCLS